MRLFLIRHAPIEAAYRGRIVGRLDVAAELPAAAAVGAMPWGPEARWLVSPARRARETAGWLGATRWVEEADLWEQSHGDWEGRTWADVLASDPEAAAYLEAFDRRRPPGGEHLGDVRRRVTRAIARATAAFPAEDLVVVCHAGPIRCLVASALGVRTRRAAFLDVEPLSLSTLTATPGGYRLSALNQPYGSW
ncbi:MAG: histidine phosphatase family protein [Candidatus Sericytochromatia bacterium]|nr:histidine phosphatase family protein [Candidatus Sericytochromatia bacterium]